MQSRSLLKVVLAACVSTVLCTAYTASADPRQPASSSTSSAWRSVGPNSSGGQLAFTPDAPSRLYVLPDSGSAVFRSDDRGLTWRDPASLGIPGIHGIRIAAAPDDANRVWVTAYTPGRYQKSYILRSDDGGQTFRPVLITSSGLNDLVVSPSGGALFAAGSAGVYQSLDRGDHWTLLPGSPAGARRLVLNGPNLVVGTGKTLYLIKNVLQDPAIAEPLALPATIFTTYLSSQGSVVVASPLRNGGATISTDGGQTWQTLVGPWGTDTVVFSTVTSDQIQVQTIQSSSNGTAARKNLWISLDDGQTWTARPLATPAVDEYSAAGTFPHHPDQEVVSGPAGVFATQDSTHFRRIGVPATEVDSMTQYGSLLVAGTTAGSYASSAPLDRHLADGYQDWGWTGRAPVTLGNAIGALAVVPQGLLRVRDAYCPDSCIALELSTDNGNDWQTLAFADGESNSLAVDPNNANRLYIGTSATFTGIYSSTDGGQTLQPHYLPGLLGVRSVAVDPQTEGSIWIGDYSGLYRSRDGGRTATKIFAGDVERVVVDPRDPKHIVAVGEKMIKISRDGGASFEDVSGIPTTTYSDVAFAPDGTLIVSSANSVDGPGQGVIASADGGTHWADVSSGLPDHDVRSLLVSTDGRWLFAGTALSGVYRIPVDFLAEGS